MIPLNITIDNILSGIQRAHKDSYPDNRASDDYDVWYNGNLYPPKVIISYSNFFANKVDHPSSKFHGGDESNHFLMDRGFPILLKSAINREDFFSELDIYFFNQAIKSNYDSTNPIDRNKAEYLKQNIWRRSNHWADLLAEDGTFKVTGGIRWNDRKGNGQGFKKYSWYKLHLTSNFHPQIFYTVGVDSRDMALVIKIDCQREGADKLYFPFQQYFDTMKKDRDLENWRMFNLDELKDLSWEQLITESQVYISETLNIYHDIIEHITSHRVTKYARICWNDYRWIRPSGFLGKSVTARQSQNFIHERENGFAPEEWLFDLEKTIDGFHYARIEPINTKTNKHIHQKYDLIFYSLNSITSKWFWVGEIANAVVISKDDSKRIYKEYKNRHWWKEQLQQLEELREMDENS
jgi:hypothetical protein